MISYSAEDHTYRLLATGERLLSVTQVLKLAGLRADYAGIPPHILKHAAERGSYVDQCIALGDDLDVESVHPEAMGYLKAWDSFCRVEGYRPLEEQTIVYHPELKYAGTVDSIGAFGDAGVLVERKCTAKLDVAYTIQAAAYGMPGMWFPPGVTHNGLLRRWIVQLKRDGTYEAVDCDKEMARTGRDDFEAFRAAVAIARWKLAGQNGGRRR